MFATLDFVSALRRLTVEHVIKNWTYFRNFAIVRDQPATSSFQYFNYMSKDGTYGDECEVLALAEILSLKIVVHTADGVRYYCSDNPTHVIYLKFSGSYFSGHFEAFHPNLQPIRNSKSQKLVRFQDPLPLSRDESPQSLEYPPCATPCVRNATPRACSNNLETIAPLINSSSRGSVNTPCDEVTQQPFGDSQKRCDFIFHTRQRATSLTDTSFEFSASDSDNDPIPSLPSPPSSPPPPLSPQPPTSSPPAPPLPARPPAFSPLSESSLGLPSATENPFDHLQAYLVSNPANQSLPNIRQDSIPASVSTLGLSLPPRTQWYLPVTLCNSSALALLDNGSTYSLCHPDMVGSNVLDRTSPIPSLRTAAGFPVKIQGTFKTILSCANMKIPHSFFVCEKLSHSVILGLAFLYQSSALMDFKTDSLSLTFNDKQQKFMFQTTSPTCPLTAASVHHDLDLINPKEIYCNDRKLHASKEITIPPKKFGSVRFYAFPLPLSEAGIFHFNTRLADELQASHLDFLLDPSCKFMRFYNDSDQPVTISKGRLLGKILSSESDLALYVSSIGDCDPPPCPAPPLLTGCVVDSHSTSNGDYAEIKLPPPPPDNPVPMSNYFDISPGLPPEQFEQARALLLEFEDVFAADFSQLQEPCVFEVSLPIRPGATVTYVPQYPLSPQQMKYALEYVRILEQYNLCRKSNSIYNSPIHIVEKRKESPDEPTSYRFLLSMKAINQSVLKRANYALPSARDLMAKMAFKSVFCKMDLLSSFWQCGLDETSQKLCAFTLNNQSYTLLRLPQGSKVSIQIFSTVIKQCFQELLGSKLFNFVDDLVTGADTFPEMLSIMREVFQCLRSAKLKLNPKKSKFFYSEVPFLGHIVSKTGTRPDPTRFRPLEALLKVRTKTDARRAFGFLSHNRRCVKSFALRTKIITAVTGPKSPFLWTSEHDNVVREIYEEIKTSFLPHFDPTLPTRISTDGSKVGLGGILEQQPPDGTTWRAFSFYSRLTTGPESRWPPVHIELLAICETCLYFRQELLQVPFEVVTDATGVLNILQTKSPGVRLARFIDCLSQFDITKFTYRRGTLNPADPLSRCPDPETRPSSDPGPSPFLADDAVCTVLRSGQPYSAPWFPPSVAPCLTLFSPDYDTCPAQTGLSVSPLPDSPLGSATAASILPPHYIVSTATLGCDTVAHPERAHFHSAPPGSVFSCHPYDLRTRPLPHSAATDRGDKLAPKRPAPNPLPPSADVPSIPRLRPRLGSGPSAPDASGRTILAAPSPPPPDNAPMATRLRSGFNLLRPSASRDDTPPPPPPPLAPDPPPGFAPRAGLQAPDSSPLESNQSKVDPTLPDLRLAQSKDPFISNIRDKLRSNHSDPISKRFQIINEIVHTTSPSPRIYVPASLRPLLLHEAHDSLLAGHLGQRKVCDRLAAYYWPNLAHDVARYVESCQLCSQFKTSTRSHGVLKPIVAQFPMHLVTVDLKTMPLTPSGYRYLAVFVENFTRFVQCYPMKSSSADEACSVLRQFVLTFGAFHVLLTDYGSCFTAKLFRRLLKSLGSRVQFSPVAFHSTSGASEASIKTIGQTLTMYLNKSLDNWPQLVAAAQLAINTSKNFSLNCSPFSLLYGFECLTPVQLLSACLPPSIRPTDKLTNHFALRAASRQRLAIAQARQKYYYDLKRKDTQYSRGQKVYVRREINKRNKKFLPKFIGPAVIKRQTGPSSYIVRVPFRNGTKLRKYHVQRMKPYFSRPQNLQLPTPQAQLPLLCHVHSVPPQSLSLCTWNVNGLRALCRKQAHDFILDNSFDAVFLQETKCLPSFVSQTFSTHGFKCFSVPSPSNVGYAGVSILTKQIPDRVVVGFDNEPGESARVITLYFSHYILLSVYAPYSGFHLQKLDSKIEWFNKFITFVQSLQSSNLPIILGGDFNVAATHRDIHPAEYSLSPASATPMERSLFQSVLSLGFIDSFRALNADAEHKYSFWGFYPKHLYDNIGIRLDYFLVPISLRQYISHVSIAADIAGSDHAPCLLTLTAPGAVP